MSRNINNRDDLHAFVRAQVAKGIEVAEGDTIAIGVCGAGVVPVNDQFFTDAAEWFEITEAAARRWLHDAEAEADDDG